MKMHMIANYATHMTNNKISQACLCTGPT